MAKYSRTKLKIHPKEGLEMETYATPFIKTMIGIAIFLIALGVFTLCATPFATALFDFLR